MSIIESNIMINEQKAVKNNHNTVYAYPADRTLRDLIGKSTALSDIFTEEKIKACQKLVDEAKSEFFNTAQDDMNTIIGLVDNKVFDDNYRELCKELFQPLSNIKGQAEVFGFSLIARICKYLIEFCEKSSDVEQTTVKDIFIITKLVEALQKSFSAKIIDSGGVLEKELVLIIEQVLR